MPSFLRAIIISLVLGLLLYQPIFGHLEVLSIRQWDESRLAINALEMYRSGDFITTRFAGQPDNWNSKPPMMIWMQVAGMQLVGPGELAVRLPSAFAALFTCILIIYFSHRYLRSYWFGIFAVMVLITSQGYISVHGTRTGDYDSLLTFFTTAYCLFFLLFLKYRKTKYLYLVFLAISFAVLTKSAAGLIFTPALAIIALLEKAALPILRNKHFYLGLGIFLILVPGYYLLREQLSPGYLDAVWYNEFAGRYATGLDVHENPFLFYFENFHKRLSFWYWFLLPGIAAAFLLKEKVYRQLCLHLLIIAGFFFLVISTAKTKLPWYDLPLYPFIAMIISFFVYWVFKIINQSEKLKNPVWNTTLAALFLIALFAKPYVEIFKKTYHPREYHWDEAYFAPGYFLRDALHGDYRIANMYLPEHAYDAHITFYLMQLRQKKLAPELVEWEKLNPGDTLIIFEENHKAELSSRFRYEVAENSEHIDIVKITAEKMNES